MDKNDQKIKLMAEEKIPKVLLKFSVPVIIGMLVTAFYNVIDAMFVGGLGTSAIGAVSIAFPISMFLMGLGLTFGSGASSYISRLLGQGNIVQANRTASTAFFSSLFIGILTITIILSFLDEVLLSFGATTTILPYARDFSSIFIAGSILSIIDVTLNNIAISEGAAKISMTAMIAGVIINVILEPLFIYTFGWGIKGAAIANVVAQSVTTFLYLQYFWGNKSYVKIAFQYFVVDKEIYTQILKVGLPLLIYQILTSASMGLTNAAASNFGDAAVAAMGIVTRVFAIVTYVVFGYSKGFQPLAGFNYGAKKIDRLKEAVSVSLKWTTWFCGISALLIMGFSNSIVALFSNDRAVIDIGSKALIANSVIFISFGFQTIYISLFLALGKAKAGGVLSMGRQGIFFIPVIFVLPPIIGIDGVIYTQLIADILTTLLTAILAVILKKEINGLTENNMEQPAELLHEN
ncbi:MATE family efflux transporter [Sporomusa acidovorans]|uniref:Multidrug export protein MepA n=1 Tax=Sporomusa acidovorans (strain ATCC 49682 / DSM 3132 / Mol) TaxID=1123286 RepID=A0ABZ3IYT0_SPOA4|nr:MATE family efflux transporter [Sporomusa acidovorans]OZC16951.1 multidrug export protein MepA [Sporomusa acidovorans DSM 3132]SDE13591.1 putative efflux protein, MATE family [Sporomusa acidovorans]